MPVLLWWMGCVFVKDHRDDPVDTGDPGLCASDEECPGNYACYDRVQDWTDDRGCIERCGSDWDCKAGSVCNDAGACVN